ncbi:MAG: hypothetical protein ACT4OT_08470 [Acidobacteriota bacterium]
MTHRMIPSAILSIGLAFNLCLGQTAFMQLTPGVSTRGDAERVLGQPVSKMSETLFEYSAQRNQQKVYIQYHQESAVIDRIEAIFDRPIDRSSLANLLGIAQQADTTKWDSKGRLEEYFGAGKLVVLTHPSSEVSSPVYRVGYYSRDLFAVALRKPTGTPKRSDGPPPGVTSSSSHPGSAPKTFKNVELLVPKGDKSESKSVRLLFDGRAVIIDADRGEKIYKQFPYNSIVSAEYSYSTSPRWKTAVGAAVLIGVFALPIFFMKSKKHWLTVKTSNDFAILHLDKDNYRMILATVETTTGTKVETVADKK